MSGKAAKRKRALERTRAETAPERLQQAGGRLWLATLLAVALVVAVGIGVKWVEEFGYLTIPTMAATAFVLVILLLALTLGPSRTTLRA